MDSSIKNLANSSEHFTSSGITADDSIYPCLDILAETPEVSAAKSELHDECFRERYLRTAAIVKVDVSPATWAAFEQTVIQGQSCEDAAESLGKSIGTIYAARSRIFKRLQIEVQRLGGDTR